MVDGEKVVKWLYPGAGEPVDPNQAGGGASSPELDSELQTDQSVQGSEMEQSTPTSSGTDTDSMASPADIPNDDTLTNISDGLSSKMAAASQYMGSFFNASSWNSEKAQKEEKNGESKEAGESKVKEAGKPEETPAESGDNKQGNNMASLSSSFFSMIGKVAYTDQKVDDEDQEKEEQTEKKEEEGGQAEAKKKGAAAGQGGLGYLTSAFNKISLTAITQHNTKTTDKADGPTDASPDSPAESKDQEVDKEEGADGKAFLTSAFSKVSKAASTYGKVIQESVAKAPLLGEFNKEQEEFIKSKGDKELPTAPWSGYQDEEQLKEKILALSQDQRNFLRAPPAGVNFDLETCGVAAHAIVLLKEDPRLEKLRYELVPKKIKEEEFWRNYFYRVSLVKQSFELTSGLGEAASRGPSKPVNSQAAQLDEELPAGPAGAANSADDEEFISDSHQASSKDLAEADEAMKKLGITKDDAEWEAELEGELNEYELVGEGGEGNSADWEKEIEAMLDAEGKDGK